MISRYSVSDKLMTAVHTMYDGAVDGIKLKSSCQSRLSLKGAQDRSRFRDTQETCGIYLSINPYKTKSAKKRTSANSQRWPPRVQVMDLCLLRNDISGRLRYSQEEGLSKQSIERLPQTKYKLPVSKGSKGATAAAARKPQQEDAQAQQQQQGGDVLDASSGTALPGQEGGSVSALDALGKVQDRDSTEDMCAICLIDYEAGDVIRIIPGCRHKFHKVRVLFACSSIRWLVG